MISMFYTKKEMATRMAILYTGNMLASSFSGLIAAAVFQLDGKQGLAGWKWLFVRIFNAFHVSQSQLMFADHPRRHLNRHSIRCCLHSAGQSLEDPLAYARGERTRSSPHF